LSRRCRNIKRSVESEFDFGETVCSEESSSAAQIKERTSKTKKQPTPELSKTSSNENLSEERTTVDAQEKEQRFL